MCRCSPRREKNTTHLYLHAPRGFTFSHPPSTREYEKNTGRATPLTPSSNLDQGRSSTKELNTAGTKTVKRTSKLPRHKWHVLYSTCTCIAADERHPRRQSNANRTPDALDKLLQKGSKGVDWLPCEVGNILMAT